jgi:hypothetical protein
MRALFLVIDLILQLYIYADRGGSVVHVVNARNWLVAMAGDFLYRVTERSCARSEHAS